MEFFNSLGVVVILGIAYSVIDMLVRNLDGYVYIRAAMILVWLLAATLDYFLDWTGITRLIFESIIAAMAVIFLLPIYLLVKFLFYAFDPFSRQVTLEDRDKNQ